MNIKQGIREGNAISRAAENIGEYTLTNNLSTTPEIRKANFAGVSGVLISGSASALTFYVANGDSPFREFKEDYTGDTDCFVAPSGIWAFEKVKIVRASGTALYAIRIVN